MIDTGARAEDDSVGVENATALGGTWRCVTVGGRARGNGMPQGSGSGSGQEPGIAACDRLASILEKAVAREAETEHLSGDDGVRVPLGQYALSVVRMRLRPALNPGWLAADPVQVVMFGGTNSGKSTVLNLLLGRAAAGMSARARYSQFPEAFRAPAVGNRFIECFPSRFAGYSRYIDCHPPRQEDDALVRDGYRPALALIDPASLAGRAFAEPATRAAVLWDIPDFSTEEAQRYLSAVFDTVALADLVVMTVTRENYADHRGALLRALVCDSGVPLRVVANKLEPATGLLADIQRKLGDSFSGAGIDTTRIDPLPQVSASDEVATLEALMMTPEAGALRRAVADDIARGRELKRGALAGALAFLERRLDDALAPLWQQVAQARRWHDVVDRAARTEFYDRYRRSYLDGEQYVDFNRTLVKLMDLLEIPGVGGIISAVSKGLKAVSRFVIGSVMSGVRNLFARGDTTPRRGPELEVVAVAFEQWIEALRSEAQALSEREGTPAWSQIEQTLADPDFLDEYGDKLGGAYQRYRDAMDLVTTARAKVLYELIARQPALLNTLRGVKVTLDVGTTALIVSSGGLNWTDAVIGPLVAPLQRLILEFGLDQYMSAQKAQLKQEQIAALRSVVEDRMIAPVRALYATEIDQGALQRARLDFELVRGELSRVAFAGGSDL